jgi:hypothetical protein
MEQLITLAKKLKGFLLLAAVVFLGMIWLLPQLFPKGIGPLESGDLVTVIQVIFGGFFCVTVILLLLSFKKSEPTAAGTLFVTVHENGNKTAGIPDAEVRFYLPEPAIKRTDERGAVSFNFSSDHAGKKFPLNAAKNGYQKRKPMNVTATTSGQCWVPLKKNSTDRNAKPKPAKLSTDDDDLPPLPTCPFVAGPKIEDPRLFIGREEELNAIVWRMRGVQPTSVNVVGERRIGKSSLLYHFRQTWADRVRDERKFAVVYLSLQEAHFQTCEGFFHTVLEKLNCAVADGCGLESEADIQGEKVDGSVFVDALTSWKAQRILPVVCLDEFEMFLKYPQEFTDGFFDHLRSQMDQNALMFVVSSLKPLDVYRREHKLTSSFFNLGHCLRLTEMTGDDADALVRLPASTMPGLEPALSQELRQMAKQWGGRQPMLLQLAAMYLCQAGMDGKDTAWADERFREQAAHFEPVLGGENSK